MRSLGVGESVTLSVPMPRAPFSVNRERFLVLVAALSPGCAEPLPGAVPKQPEPKSVQIAEPEATEEEEAETAEPGVTESVESVSACDADAGEIDCTSIARRAIGPACEGVVGACELLGKGYGFKRRVGEAIAKCWDKLGSRVCNIEARQRCNREGLKAGCSDPKWEAPCQAQIDRCQASQTRVEYTLAECVQVASSLDDANRDWAIRAMGPAAEGCRLMFPVY
jgi:hypothetical protein